MSDAEFKAPTSDQRSHSQFEKFWHGLKESGSDITRPHAHQVFFAGWNARFNVSVDQFGGSSHEADDDLVVLFDHIRSVTKALTSAQEKYYNMYRSYYHSLRLQNSWRSALKAKREDDGTVFAWKRVTMQRKELRAMAQFQGVQAARIRELEAEIETLKAAKS